MINPKALAKYPAMAYRISKQFIKQNSPTILSAFAVGGVVSTAIMAVRATPKAQKLLEEAWEKKNEEYLNYQGDLEQEPEQLTVLETIRVAGPVYAPSLIMGTATIGCILGANSLNLRRQAALASLYSISEATLKEYKEKAKELVGPKKAQAIEDECIQDIVSKHPVGPEGIIRTGHGETIFFDPLIGRYFRSDIEYVRRVENDIKGMIYGDMCASLNDFYFQNDLDGVKLGEDFGWNVENMIDLKFTGALMSDGTPCIALVYNVGPVHNYQYTFR